MLAYSTTCDTQADAEARIAGTGATGGLTRRAAFTLQNGLDAQALNKKFQGLTASSPCTDGEQACVQGQFAQCVGGAFQLTPCAAPLQCFALPLDNKPGTRYAPFPHTHSHPPLPPHWGRRVACNSLLTPYIVTISTACDSQADALARIAGTGATGGLVGKRDIEARQTAPPACASKAKRDLMPTTLLTKRIAQTDLGQVAQSWQDLCVASGGPRPAGNDPCLQLAGINGINSLLANADQCAQQNNADAMIDFAKLPGITNQQALIANAIAYRKHPRNALDINGVVPSTLFCEKAPRNPELQGIANAQLAGVNPGLFGSPSAGIVAFGACEYLILHSLSLSPAWGTKAWETRITDRLSPPSHSWYLPLRPDC
jgi:hypothetical protein